jgi:hypothetical protein
LLATLFGQFPFLAKLFADSAYAGSIFHTALTKVSPNLKTEIVKRSDRAKGFVPLPFWSACGPPGGRLALALVPTPRFPGVGAFAGWPAFAPNGTEANNSIQPTFSLRPKLPSRHLCY